ncbi:angiogenic factor with G patch and FHA domains 1-like isoform X2 [Ctenocephalides felis]|uniref:angiogenic factor with G patch and FHA domains 1-like isoform X2 n=1 Tax=Ctenocephalides felis TaxID=7515 RepID=UPI000E6E3690|nr:angiogenic factor with G patch and FHA domains 1-like isoform X2 [Ctenocephalides felis]
MSNNPGSTYGDDACQMPNVELPDVQYEEKLKDFPEIVEYINTLHDVIDIQAQVLTNVRNALADPPKICFKSINNKHESTTVDAVAKIELSQSKEVSENIQSNFVYEPVSGMYYDYSTGYYYDADLCLYYDGNAGCYYQYDETEKKYKLHSCSDVSKGSNELSGNITSELTSGKCVIGSPVSYNGKRYQTTEKHSQLSSQHIDLELSHRNKRIKKNRSKTSEVEREEGECSDDSDVPSECSADAIMETTRMGHPAMRIIVAESNNSKIKVGTLFLITCSGGTIGREGNHAIVLPDINISKNHLQLTYAECSKLYYVIDMGSRNGSYLNGKRLSESKKRSDPMEVIHGSLIQIGGINLLCHIHFGDATCDSCEPGLVQAELALNSLTKDNQMNKEDIRIQHKRELQRLKKHYALASNSVPVSSSNTYNDRAQTRREVVGVDNPHGKEEVASVEQSVSSKNKGYLMLSKMGWNSGEGLGKDSSGLIEPIPLISNNGTSGLGMNIPDLLEINSGTEKKRIKWKKAQERFKQSAATHN